MKQLAPSVVLLFGIFLGLLFGNGTVAALAKGVTSATEANSAPVVGRYQASVVPKGENFDLCTTDTTSGKTICGKWSNAAFDGQGNQLKLDRVGYAGRPVWSGNIAFEVFLNPFEKF